MNILVVTGSPRKNGNTEIMAEVFAQSATEAGHQVTVRKLSELKVNPLQCYSTPVQMVYMLQPKHS